MRAALRDAGPQQYRGNSLAALLLQTVRTTTSHFLTEELTNITRQADIYVSMMGKTNFLTTDMAKEGPWSSTEYLTYAVVSHQGTINDEISLEDDFKRIPLGMQQGYL